MTDIWTPPVDLITGEFVDADKWNEELAANLRVLGTPIAASVLGAPAASIDLTSIPQIFTHLRLRMQLRNSGAVTAIGLKIRLNNDSGTNYVYESDGGVSGTPTSTEATADTGFAPEIVGDSGTANVASYVEILFPFYTGTTWYKEAFVLNQFGSAAGSMSAILLGGYWKNTAAITRITVLATADNHKTGSAYQLVGEL